MLHDAKSVIAAMHRYCNPIHLANALSAIEAVLCNPGWCRSNVTEEIEICVNESRQVTYQLEIPLAGAMSPGVCSEIKRRCLLAGWQKVEIVADSKDRTVVKLFYTESALAFWPETLTEG